MRRLARLIAAVHRDERGLTSLETVAILAVAAIVLATAKSAWHRIKLWFRETVTDVVEWQGEPE